MNGISANRVAIRCAAEYGLFHVLVEAPAEISVMRVLNGASSMKKILSMMFLGCSFVGSAIAGDTQVTIDIEDLGWYTDSGEHRADNPNTLTGSGPGGMYRSFYQWALPQLQGVVIAARIDFEMPYSIGASGVRPQTGEIFDVSPTNLPYLRLENGGGNGTAIFDDLGSGVQYGTVEVPSSYYYRDYTLTVHLNAAALQALNSRAPVFAMGIKNSVANPRGYFLFSSGSRPASQRLVLTVSPVPEPGVVTISMVGALLVVVASRRKG